MDIGARPTLHAPSFGPTSRPLRPEERISVADLYPRRSFVEIQNDLLERIKDMWQITDNALQDQQRSAYAALSALHKVSVLLLGTRLVLNEFLTTLDVLGRMHPQGVAAPATVPLQPQPAGRMSLPNLPERPAPTHHLLWRERK